MHTALAALHRLQEGNRRFAGGTPGSGQSLIHARRAELVDGQSPFAIVLGCSDSRVPVEIVFDQGLGDLFVIRVAGNIVAPSLVASAEFAAEKFGTRLVVVLGHSGCGAIQATLAELGLPEERRSHNLHSLVDRIRPSVEGFVGQPIAAETVARAVRANVAASVQHLQQDSEILKRLIAEDGLLVVGAVYDLESGVVEFLP